MSKIFEQAIERYTHRMHGGTEYFSYAGIDAAFRDVFGDVPAANIRECLNKVRPSLDMGEFYSKADIVVAMDRYNDLRCESSGPI